MRRLDACVRSLLVLVALPALAQESEDAAPASSAASFLERVELHGFGGWAYGDSDENPISVATPAGSWNNASGGLMLSAKPVERLLVHLQVAAHAGHGHGSDDEGSVTLDRVFAQWSFNDAVKLRGGKVPHPIGVYSEIYDVGTLRPLFDLPHTVYGSAGISGEAYEGIGLTGYRSLGDFGVSYDLYLGEVDLEIAEPFERFGCALILTCDAEEEEREVDDLLGGRLVLETPVGGLSVGGAFYLSLADSGEHRVAGMQATYQGADLRVASEYYNTSQEEGDQTIDSFYLEGGHRLFRALGLDALEPVELAARFEWSDVDFDAPTLVRLTQHRSFELGFNYWFADSFVARLSYQNVRGNLFAFDDEEIEAGVIPSRTTNAFLAGLQASF